MIYYLKVGEIDRAKLARIIFSDKEKKAKIDELTVQYVVPRLKEIVEAFSRV